jgi:hypothetical protein
MTKKGGLRMTKKGGLRITNGQYEAIFASRSWWVVVYAEAEIHG